MLTDGPQRSGNLKFLAVARAQSKDVVASFTASSKDAPEQFHNTVREVLAAPGFAGKVTAGARYRLAGDVNAFNFTLDNDQRVYIVISALEYPERLVFALINELIPKFQQEFGPQSLSCPAGALDSKTKSLFQFFVEEYDDPAKKDKLADARRKVAGVKDVMGENLNKMLTNIDKARDIEESSANLRDQADAFQRHSTSLKRKELWRKWQTTGMIVCLILIVIVILIIAFVGPATAGTAVTPGATSPPTGTAPPTAPPTPGST